MKDIARVTIDALRNDGKNGKRVCNSLLTAEFIMH